MDELQSNGDIIFDEEGLNSAYSTFNVYLEKNFNLDSNLNAINNQFIEGKVSIVDFRIYNVEDNKTTEYDYNSSGGIFIKSEDGTTATIYTPNNKQVKRTSVYTSISVNMKMIFKYDDENNSKKITIDSYTDAVN